MKKLLNKNQAIDELESVIITYPEVECPLIHRFTPGMYIREIFMPAGTLLTSKIHKTEHPFVISKGKVSVWTEEDNVVVIEAPYCGITKPGTRRILFIHEDAVWTTFHATDKKTPEEVEDDIIEKHDNPLLPAEIKIKNNLNKKKEDLLCHS